MYLWGIQKLGQGWDHESSISAGYRRIQNSLRRTGMSRGGPQVSLPTAADWQLGRPTPFLLKHGAPPLGNKAPCWLVLSPQTPQHLVWEGCKMNFPKCFVLLTAKSNWVKHILTWLITFRVPKRHDINWRWFCLFLSGLRQFVKQNALGMPAIITLVLVVCRESVD